MFESQIHLRRVFGSRERVIQGDMMVSKECLYQKMKPWDEHDVGLAQFVFVSVGLDAD